MLTDHEKEEIQQEAKAFPYPQAVCLDALKIVQHQRGWVSDEAIQDIAAYLDMSADEVESVATFYSRIYRRPVGRHVILICDSMSCMILGYEKLYDYLAAKLGIRFGGTTGDGRFTLLPISCLGDCNLGPSMMIDNDLYSLVTNEKIDELLEKYN
ncbi:MAG: NADH-quinone oxidoreductase subunit NuoE [Candidatus Saccharibacteria bacterium]